MMACMVLGILDLDWSLIPELVVLGSVENIISTVVLSI